jgi:hypothetical protein
MFSPFAAACLLAATTLPAGEAKIEFRWLEDRPIAGVTLDRGFPTTCGEERSYAHKTPILTNDDLAWATATNHGSIMGLPGDHYSIEFRLTEKARRKLLADCPDGSTRTLAVFIDGQYKGTTPYRPAKPSGFAPSAGTFTSKAQVERIVKPFQ